jgi:hypothetical protein
MRSAMSNFGYHTIVTIFWLIISYYSGFYEVYRYSKGVEIFAKLLNQFFFTSLITFAYVGYKYKYVTTQEVGFYILCSFVVVAFLKFSVFISHSNASPGIPTLIIFLSFFGGIQLFFLGLIGEYVLSIHGQIRPEPEPFDLILINFDK